MKNLILAGVFSVLFLPVLVSAQTNTDISTQAQALLNQILLLQQQLGVAQDGAGASSGGCPTPGVTLRPGSRGEDVTRLQQFLAADRAVYPEAIVSGYYGALTQAAVGRWQAKNGIVSSGSPSTNGFGAFGPRTAAAVALQCTGSTTGGNSSAPSDAVVGAFMNVSPITGAAPLTVTVEATVNTVKLCGASTYTLNWGDGSASQVILVPANSCNILAQTFTHTYSSAGTYGIKLASGAHESVSTITVTGAGSQGTSGTSATPGTLAISMNANSFSPSIATVDSGTVVTWTNTDSMNHTVTADNASYNKSLAPGESYSLTFTIRGEYKYYCALHGAAGGVGMSGKIIVE